MDTTNDSKGGKRRQEQELSVPSFEHPEEYTLQAFADRMCLGWDFPDHWLAWPPDIFGFVSLVFQRTGVYRSLLSPVWQPGNGWQRTTADAANVWRTNLNCLLKKQNHTFRTAVEEAMEEASPPNQEDEGGDSVALRISITEDNWLDLFDITQQEKLRIQELREQRNEENDAFEISELQMFTDCDQDAVWREEIQKHGPTQIGSEQSNNVQVRKACWIAVAAILDLQEYAQKTTIADLRTFPKRFDDPPPSIFTYKEDGSESSNSDARFRRYRQHAVLIYALARIHAMADLASANFGMLSTQSATSSSYGFFGNLLLTVRGSLSTIPKQWGIVLPKMRTPQRGFTVRSLSHHLTCHSSEVEVMWRVTPILNQPKNTLNILSLPWPPSIHKTDFKVSEEFFEPWRGFNYDPEPASGAGDKDRSFPVDLVCRMLVQLERQGTPPQVLVLPEASITRKEFVSLLNVLRTEHQRHEPGRRTLSSLPMIIAGLRHTRSDRSDRHGSHLKDDAAVEPDSEKSKTHLNEVRLATYFAGKWYVIGQYKHHRWQLDVNQIRQYRLTGHLASDRKWFENIQFGQRRLSVLAPNSWLSISPLICEDLAQLEPVSELIRGIGPTLLVSILMDGPQLSWRWAARYASVFADDPGTAVLNQTSLGMCIRSQRLSDGHVTPSESLSRITTSWKDPVSGFKALSLGASKGAKHGLPEGEETKDSNTPPYPDAILITAKATWNEEFTADGRSDNQAASSLEYEGSRLCYFRNALGKNVHEPPGESEEVERGPFGHSLSESHRDRLMIEEPTIGLWHEFREHTVALYVLDAVMETMADDFVKSQEDKESFYQFTWWTTKKAGDAANHTLDTGISLYNDRDIEESNTSIASRHIRILEMVLRGLAEPSSYGIASPRRTSKDQKPSWPTSTTSKIDELSKSAFDDLSQSGGRSRANRSQESPPAEDAKDINRVSDYWMGLISLAEKLLENHKWSVPALDLEDVAGRFKMHEITRRIRDAIDPFDADWLGGDPETRSEQTKSWDEVRLQRAIPLAILVLIHYRLDDYRGDSPIAATERDRYAKFEETKVTIEEARRMITKIENLYDKYRM